MKYTIPDALQALKPGAQWTLIGDEYSGLEWLDGSHTKPTETEELTIIHNGKSPSPCRINSSLLFKLIIVDPIE